MILWPLVGRVWATRHVTAMDLSHTWISSFDLRDILTVASKLTGSASDWLTALYLHTWYW